MTYPLVRELAVDGIPVAVTCRVLEIATLIWDASQRVLPRLALRSMSPVHDLLGDAAPGLRRKPALSKPLQEGARNLLTTFLTTR